MKKKKKKTQPSAISIIVFVKYVCKETTVVLITRIYGNIQF